MTAATPLVEYFPRAPITEAVLDFQVVTPAKLTLQDLERFQAFVTADYPKRNQRTDFEAQFKLEKGTLMSATPKSTAVGYVFSSADGKQVAQVRLDGFSFSRLKPYLGWDQFVKEARRLWDFYRAIAAPTSIKRIGLRYINRMELPLPFSAFKDYVLTVPEAAPAIPQSLAGFFMRLQIPLEDASAIVSETIQPDEQHPEVLPFILDIDVFQTEPVDASDAVWARVDRFREMKNQLFFGSITERTRALFR